MENIDEICTRIDEMKQHLAENYAEDLVVDMLNELRQIKFDIEDSMNSIQHVDNSKIKELLKKKIMLLYQSFVKPDVTTSTTHSKEDEEQTSVIGIDLHVNKLNHITSLLAASLPSIKKYEVL